jgi:hypothetical protein
MTSISSQMWTNLKTRHVCTHSFVVDSITTPSTILQLTVGQCHTERRLTTISNNQMKWNQILISRMKSLLDPDSAAQPSEYFTYKTTDIFQLFQISILENLKLIYKILQSILVRPNGECSLTMNFDNNYRQTPSQQNEVRRSCNVPQHDASRPGESCPKG